MLDIFVLVTFHGHIPTTRSILKSMYHWVTFEVFHYGYDVGPRPVSADAGPNPQDMGQRNGNRAGLIFGLHANSFFASRVNSHLGPSVICQLQFWSASLKLKPYLFFFLKLLILRVCCLVI